jgi:peptidoglycan/LPS O-acetylase OafA/YrhL
MPLHGAGNHFWSICAEEQFYLIAPLFLVLAPPRLGRSLGLWLGVAVLDLGGYGSIALGVAAAIARVRFGAFHLRRPCRLGLAALGAAALLALWAGALPYRYSAPWIACAAVLLLARPAKKQVVAGFLGGMSYPLYLDHWLGLAVAHSIAKRLDLDPAVSSLVLGLPLAFALAALLYVSVDRRVLFARSRWYSPRAGRAATLGAYATIAVGLVGALCFAR